jgi:hypothetical protein
MFYWVTLLKYSYLLFLRDMQLGTTMATHIRLSNTC